MKSNTPRAILRDPSVLAGRWHLAGTTFAIAEIRLDHIASGMLPGYQYPGVTAGELATCLDFAFPAIRDSRVSMLCGAVVLACSCGEDTTASGVLDEAITCVCGRQWRLSIVLEPIAEASAPARRPKSPNGELH